MQNGELSDEALALIFDRRNEEESTEPPAEEVDVTRYARKLVDIVLGAQTRNGEMETMVIPTVWTEAYLRCTAPTEEEAWNDVVGRAAIEVAHCGSEFCQKRPPSDEGRGACGCGCPPCSQLSAHLRPPPGGGRADGAGAPEPAVPSVAIARPPKPSAAERTVPLFEETYPVKSTWEAAYARVLVELAPPLSPALLARVAARMREQQHGFSTETASSTAAMPTEAEDPDFVAPPRDDSESGFTNPDGTLIKVHQSTPTVVLTGVIPPHILTELGMHPSLVDEPVRNRALVVARHTGWSDDWDVLQEQAPTGFFTRVLKEMQMAPGERLSVLVEAMVERGLRVSIFDAAGWSSIQRSCARACIEQNSEWPEFFSQYEGDQAGILGSCAACGRGDNRPYTHTCEKSSTLGRLRLQLRLWLWLRSYQRPQLSPRSAGKGDHLASRTRCPRRGSWRIRE